jgi:hypothetical protein
VLFSAATLRGLTEGRLTCTYRRWTVVRPKVGSRFTTSAGMVEVTAIERVRVRDLRRADAVAAGFADLAELLAWTRAKGEGDLYRIGIALAGPDPRVALRSSDGLKPAEVADLDARLMRMDRAADEPWTRPVLRLIQRRPATVSTELAAELGQDRPYFKIRVRRLKALGLTESLEVGYRLSPRGEAYLRAQPDDR